MHDIIAISSGAVGGALSRYAISNAGKSHFPSKPWPTLFVNVTGSFLLGMAVASTSLSPRTKLLLGTGFCGSFTTFSTYSVECVHLIETGKFLDAFGYILANNVLGGGAALLGVLVSRKAHLRRIKSGIQKNTQTGSPSK